MEGDGRYKTNEGDKDYLYLLVSFECRNNFLRPGQKDKEC